MIGAIGASGTGALTGAKPTGSVDGGDEIDQRLRQLAARAGDVDRIARLDERVLRLQHGGGERRLVGGLRLVREPLEVARDVLDRHVLAHRGEGEHLRLLEEARLDGRGAGWPGSAPRCAP